MIATPNAIWFGIAVFMALQSRNAPSHGASMLAAALSGVFVCAGLAIHVH